MPRLGRGRPVEPFVVFPRLVGPQAAFGSVSLSGGGSLAVTRLKGSAAGFSLAGGGTTSVTVNKGGVSALVSSGGGSLSVVIRKTGLSTAAIQGGGSSATAARKSATGSVSLSGGGSIITQGLRPTSGMVVTMVVGGGGRLGRSHPIMAPLPRTAIVPPYVPNSAVAITGGGSSAVTWKTSRSGSVSLSGGGEAGVVGNGLQQPMVVTVVIGGGGRLGRSFPVRAVAPTGRARVFASNLNDRTSSASMSGGGSTAVSGKKGGLSETLGDAVAPPMFQVFNSGLRIRGGGVLVTSGSATAASRTGATSISGGGSFLIAGRKTGKVAMTLSAGGLLTIQRSKAALRSIALSGGGAVVTAGRKTGRGSSSVTGNGLISVSYTLRIQSSLGQPFNVMQPIGASLAQPYTTTTVGTAGASLGMPFLDNNVVGNSLGLPSRISQLAGRSLEESYTTRTAVGRSLAQPYAAGALTTVGGDLAQGYVVTVPRGASLPQSYQTGGTAGSSLAQPYHAFTITLDVTEQIFTHVSATTLLSDNHLISVREETLEVVPV